MDLVSIGPTLQKGGGFSQNRKKSFGYKTCDIARLKSSMIRWFPNFTVFDPDHTAVGFSTFSINKGRTSVVAQSVK